VYLPPQAPACRLPAGQAGTGRDPPTAENVPTEVAITFSHNA